MVSKAGIIIPILQMETLRLREVGLAKVTQRARVQNQTFRLNIVLSLLPLQPNLIRLCLEAENDLDDFTVFFKPKNLTRLMVNKLRVVFKNIDSFKSMILMNS